MHFSVRGYLEIIRPFNLVIGALAIFMGAFITGAIHPLQKIVLACISGAFIMAGGNVVNDYHDANIDRINKPHRPIPSQKVSKNSALAFEIILFALGIFLSIFISFGSFFLAISVSLGLFFYSLKLKRTVLFGNVAVSLFSALAFVYGGLAVGRWREALIPAGFAFLFHLGREIIKDIEDQEADATGGLETLPVRFGQKAALTVATLVFSILILLTFVPYFLNIYGVAYFWIVLLGVDLVLVCTLILLWRNPTPDFCGKVSKLLKADMFAGLLAIYLGLPRG